MLHTSPPASCSLSSVPLLCSSLLCSLLVWFSLFPFSLTLYHSSSSYSLLFAASYFSSCTMSLSDLSLSRLLQYISFLFSPQARLLSSLLSSSLSALGNAPPRCLSSCSHSLLILAVPWLCLPRCVLPGHAGSLLSAWPHNYLPSRAPLWHSLIPHSASPSPCVTYCYCPLCDLPLFSSLPRASSA